MPGSCTARYMTAMSKVPSSMRWVRNESSNALASTAMSGMSVRRREIQLRRKLSHRLRGAPTERRSRCTSDLLTSICAVCQTRTNASACRRNCSPADVNVAPVFERSNSSRSSCSSSERMRELTVDCVRHILRAASMKLPVSATVRKVRARLISITKMHRSIAAAVPVAASQIAPRGSSANYHSYYVSRNPIAVSGKIRL